MQGIRQQRTNAARRTTSIGRVLVAVFGALLLAAALLPSIASAGQLQFTEFEAEGLNRDGSASTQAGGRPYALKTAFAFNEVFDPRVGYDVPAATLKSQNVELPPGVLGNAQAVPQCTQEEFNVLLGHCPPTSQIGIARLELGWFGGRRIEETPIYNLVPPPGEPAQFGFLVIAAAAHIDFSVRTDGDYGVDATVRNANTAAPFYGGTLEIWGVPADSSHDADRFLNANQKGEGFAVLTPRKPLLRNPTSCTGSSLITRSQIVTWQEPDQPSTAAAGSPAMTGCDGVPFNPTVSVAPDTRSAGGSAGLSVDISLPQNEGPEPNEGVGGVATSDLKKAVVKLPAGIAINPSGADGLAGCTDAQFGIGTSSAVDQCPAASRVGELEIVSPLLSHPLTGTAFIAAPLEQGAAAAAGGRMFRLFLEAEGSGVRIKLAGSVVPDPVTGQLTATFDDNPQLPFEKLHMQLNGGPRAPLTSPARCGRYTTVAELFPWARPGEPVTTTSAFTVSENCEAAGKFEPTLEAGTTDPSAGKASPFVLRVTEPAGQQNLSQIEATLPKGVLAKLAGVGLCPDSGAATGDCPASSQVGSTVVGAGWGAPVYVPQPGRAPTAVYLAGPYKGAPYSLIAKVPAEAGPFDLGTVAVRNALYVDPTTTQVTAKSDPLPQVLDGVPITYRDVRVQIDRSDFTINPTNCSPQQVTSNLVSIAGTSANPSSRFQPAGCGELGFNPSLALQFKGQTKRTGHPAITATLKAPAGQANIAATTVILPKSAFIDQGHVNNSCTRVQFAASACPAKSILGTAVAYTPLLDKPLEGPVYFRSNGGERKLPDLVADLNGQIHVILVGFIDSKKVGKETSLVRTRFASVPDAPVSKFVLRLKGGRRGLIQNSADLCKNTPKAEVRMTGQNGRPHDFKQKLSVKCPKKNARHKSAPKR